MRFEKDGGKFVNKLTLTQRQIRVCPDKFKGRSKIFYAGSSENRHDKLRTIPPYFQC